MSATHPISYEIRLDADEIALLLGDDPQVGREWWLQGTLRIRSVISDGLGSQVYLTLDDVVLDSPETAD